MGSFLSTESNHIRIDRELRSIGYNLPEIQISVNEMPHLTIRWYNPSSKITRTEYLSYIDYPNKDELVDHAIDYIDDIISSRGRNNTIQIEGNLVYSI